MTTVKRKNELPEDDNKKREKYTNQGKSKSKDIELYEPTLDEILESTKPDNVIAIPTMRQKKKEKLKQRQKQQLNYDCNKKQQCDEDYLLKWKYEHTEWKFAKRRQISIQQSVFDYNKINEKCWPIALEYLSGSMGTSKNVIIKLAEDVIDEMDKQSANLNEDEKSSILNSIKYKRARALLQNFV